MTGFDPKSPSVARVYDYGLGGKDNFAADREAAARLLALYPSVSKAIAANKPFVGRAVTWVAGQGVGQFVDLGAGMPLDPAVHETARAVIPDARVAYVDNDPVVNSHLNARFVTRDSPVRVLNEDICHPAAVLGALAGDIDLTRPVCLIMTMVLHFLDAETARDVVARFARALAPGSYLIISVGWAQGQDGQDFASTYNAQDGSRIYAHSRDDIAAMFDGTDLVTPGIVNCATWRVDPAPAGAAGQTSMILGAVTRRP